MSSTQKKWEKFVEKNPMGAEGTLMQLAHRGATKEQREVMVDIRFAQLHAHMLELALRGIKDIEEWNRLRVMKAAPYVLGGSAFKYVSESTDSVIKKIKKAFSKYKKAMMKDPNVLAWANEYFSWDLPKDDLTPLAEEIWKRMRHNQREFPDNM